MIALTVFAKIPVLGFAKTRIALTHGTETAHRIYNELIEATALTVNKFNYHVIYAGDNPDLLKKSFQKAESFIPQYGQTLGERLQNSSNYFFNHGYDSVVIIGSDCPFLTENDLKRAISDLDNGYDVSLGPAKDGGYYLVGIKPNAIDIFNVTSWGQATLFKDTMNVIKKKNLKCNLLPERSDIDTMKDYEAWMSGTIKLNM